MATTTTRIGPADHGRAMTVREFLDAEGEEGFRYELARGILEVTELPNDPHGEVEWFLVKSLGANDQAHHGVIRRVAAGGSIRLWLPGMASGRNPDIAVVLHDAPKDDRNRRVPAMAIEIVSIGREAHDRDYVTKRAEYLAYGLHEYWIVDPIDSRITVLVRDGDVWVERVFVGDQAAEGLVLPAFAVRLPDLWAAVQTDEGDDES